MSPTIVCALDLEHAEGTQPALDVAAGLAQRLGLPLVCAYVAAPGFLAAGGPATAGENLVVAPAPGVPYPYPLAPAAELDEVRAEARRRVERLLARRRIGDATAEVAVDASVPEGLRRIASACDAEFLVVGSRGRGALRAALLGSTSHALAGDAPCAVVVVPATD